MPESSTCSVDDCERTDIAARRLCWFHYKRYLSDRDEQQSAWKAATNERHARVIEFIEMWSNGATGCIVWPHATADGYGSVTVGSSTYKLHRLACLMANGPAPTDDVHAAHICGNRACINGRHLRWASAAENSQDREMHGTGTKLTPECVRSIRSELQAGVEQQVIAERYGVSCPTISHIRTGRRWSSV